MAGWSLTVTRQSAERMMQPVESLTRMNASKVLVVLFWAKLFIVSFAAMSQAATYFIDNPSVICKAQFKANFGEFVTQDGDEFILEFDEADYATKRRWGFRYNGVVEGKNASMLLNWPGDADAGILTVLASDYPCRASYSPEKLQQVAALDEVAAPVDEVVPSAAETGSTNNSNSLLVSELDAIVNQDDASGSQTIAAAQTGDLSAKSSQPVSGTTAGSMTATPQFKTATSNLASAPAISITSISANGPQGLVEGFVSDATGIAELQINGRIVPLDNAGRFSAKTFVPIGGTVATLTAFNTSGLSSAMSVMLERSGTQQTEFSFAQLNPLSRQIVRNDDAIAIIVGVGAYANTPAPALYADTDAQVFHDYALEKLGVPSNRIKTLINDAADERGVLLAVMRWLTRAAKPGQSDVYVFFAGHGLASDDGENMYLLPYDGAPELLAKTAILRDELFADIAAVNPRSVTVFLDTCYSGTTRGEDVLLASRPIAIRAKEQAIPEGFTVLTAASGDQTAKPLEEAKHGMFSYFLMKGMEGDADANQDNKITAGELHAYVQQNVIQQSSGLQTPELQGDADRVLVRFQ